MRLALALLLVSRLAFADGDAPKVVELTPDAHSARVEALTCQKDLKDCESSATKWIVVSVAVGVAVGFLAGLVAGLATKK